jgi:hypothetical protein
MFLLIKNLGAELENKILLLTILFSALVLFRLRGFKFINALTDIFSTAIDFGYAAASLVLTAIIAYLIYSINDRYIALVIAFFIFAISYFVLLISSDKNIRIVFIQKISKFFILVQILLLQIILFISMFSIMRTELKSVLGALLLLEFIYFFVYSYKNLCFAGYSITSSCKGFLRYFLAYLLALLSVYTIYLITGFFSYYLDQIPFSSEAVILFLSCIAGLSSYFFKSFNSDKIISRTATAMITINFLIYSAILLGVLK